MHKFFVRKHLFSEASEIDKLHSEIQSKFKLESFRQNLPKLAIVQQCLYLFPEHLVVKNGYKSDIDERTEAKM